MTMVLPAGLALSCAFLAAAAHGPRQADYDGESGLRVWFTADSLHVGWLTTRPGGGHLEVLSGSEVLFRTSTPAGIAHAAALALPRTREVVLRYGGADGGHHFETALDLRAGRDRADVVVRRPDSLFVIGDVHGEFDTLAAVLRNAGIVDESLRWSAGRSHLVVAGDMMDRGPAVTRVLWFLYRLEREARAQDGRVHIVLGNHELMVMTGDLRYVAPHELEIAAHHGIGYARLFHPAESLLGRWLTSKPGMIRVGDVLIAHGGVSREWTSTSIEAFDDTLDVYTHDDAFALWSDTTVALPLDSVAFERRTDFFWEPESVFWYRGFAQSDTLGDALRDVLEHFDARLHVVGHTPGEMVRSAYAGNLILTNTLPFGRELLLLVRAGDAWSRFRIGTAGPAEPL